MSIFEQASRRKLRFNTAIGTLAVEDLWDLPIVIGVVGDRNERKASLAGASLNDIAVALHRRIQDAEVSFADDAPAVPAGLQLQFDVVKHIIDVKRAEAAAARDAAAKAQRKQKLLDVLARKQDAALEGLSVDEIRKLIDET